MTVAFAPTLERRSHVGVWAAVAGLGDLLSRGLHERVMDWRAADAASRAGVTRHYAPLQHARARRRAHCTAFAGGEAHRFLRAPADVDRHRRAFTKQSGIHQPNTVLAHVSDHRALRPTLSRPRAGLPE